MRTGSGKRYAEPSPSTRCGEKPAIVPRSHSSRTGSSCSCQLALGGGGESPVMRWRLPSLYMRITGDLPSVKFLDHRLHLLPQQLVPTSASRDPGRSIHAFTYHTHTPRSLVAEAATASCWCYSSHLRLRAHSPRWSRACREDLCHHKATSLHLSVLRSDFSFFRLHVQSCAPGWQGSGLGLAPALSTVSVRP